MADYYPVLARAVSALAPNTPENREGVYERARSAISRQLASLDPPTAPDLIDRELDNLEQVIERLESEQSAAEFPIPDAVEATAPAAILRPQVQPKRAETGRKPWVGVAVALGAGVMAIVATLAYLRRNELPAMATRPAPNTPTVQQRPQVVAKSDDRVGPAGAEAPARAPSAPGPSAPGPSAPVPSAPVPSAPAPTAPAPTGVPTPPSPAASTPPRPQPPAAVAPASSPPAPPPPVPAPPVQPSAPVTTAPQAPASAPAGIAVANRLVFVIESSEAGQPLVVRQGSVVWRTENVNVQGQPVQVAIKAVADIPEARLRAEMMLQRNTDAALPASHTIQIQFLPQANGDVRGVQSLSVMELRQTENQPGYAIAGQGIAIVENLFLIALAQSEPALSRNIDMLRTRPLVYFEFQATGGRRAAIIMEKGIGGQQVFDDAFRSWQR